MLRHTTLADPSAGASSVKCYNTFFRTPLTAQSNVLNMPPHIPKLPPNTGALAFIAVIAPIRRSPRGEFRNPLTPCHNAPPMAWCEVPCQLGAPTITVSRSNGSSIVQD